MNKVSARARVTVTLEVDTPDTWGAECTVEQIQKQAKESAMGAIRSGLIIDGLKSGSPNHSNSVAVVIGDPKVVTILVQ